MQKNFTLKRIVCLLAALCLAAGLVGCADMPASSSEESSLPTILVGSDVYPLPWDTMKYDTDLGGYVVSLSKEQLENAPKHERNAAQDYNDEYGRKVNEYYGVPWIY